MGLAPSQMTAGPGGKLVAVANGHSDSISILDAATLARSDVKIPTFPDAALGSQPISLAFSGDGKTLYVACGGNNAIAVVRESGGQVAGGGSDSDGVVPLGGGAGRRMVRCAC